MIVTCEGCETKFSVNDRMIKPAGSKVRCSKCRHVFFAHPPAAVETEEPLTLEEELPAAPASVDLAGAKEPAGLDEPEGLNEPAGLNEIDAQLDDLFREDDFGQKGPATDAQAGDLLNVDELLAGDASDGDALTAQALGDPSEFDLDLGLSLAADEEAGAQPEKTLPPTVSAEPEAASVDFNMDLDPSGQAGLEDALPALEELEIDLDDLDGLDEAVIPAVTQTSVPHETSSSELELDLEDLGLESAAATPGAATGADIQTLLEFAPDGGAKAPESGVGRSDGAKLEPGPAAIQSTAGKGSDAVSPPSGGDMIDLSDLEAMLGGEGAGEASTQPGAATDGIDLELDLGAAVEDEAKGDEMQELDLTEIAAPPEADLGKPAGATDELDFSDISGILEETAPVAAAASPEKSTEELDLVFDDEPPAEAAQKEKFSPPEPHEDLMLDLEALLEADEEEKPEVQKPAAKITNELDLDFAAAPGRTDDGDLEIEIEPVDDRADSQAPADRPAALAAAAAAAAVGAAGASTRAAASGKSTAVTDAFSTDEFTQAGMTGATDLMDTEASPATAPDVKKAKAPQRSGGFRRRLLAAAALLALVIAALVIPRSLGIQIPYLSDVDIPYLSDIEIPFLGKIFQSEPEDTAGNLKMAPVPESVIAEFLDAPGAGRLCVIRGQVRNAYDHPRSFIRVTAKLYDRNKTVAKTETVFAGNVLSRAELSSQGFAAISARLKNKTGANNQNTGVKPGAAIPFMVVFENLPDNLDEYSVEVVGSSK
jgi:predicted Zn finger-like uncharacterized protein